MSAKRAKKTVRRKRKRKTDGSSWLWWSLLLWPLLIGGLLFYQAHRRGSFVRHELDQLEQQYKDEIAELELQIELLDKQLQAVKE